MIHDLPSLDDLRHAHQAAFLASGAELTVGDAEGLPRPPHVLASLTAASPGVTLTVDGGLTAVVHRLEAGGRRWCVKIARPESRVRNEDGRTAFLNELQRRADIEALKREPGGDARWAGLVDTRWASLRHGVILSPWIEGEAVADDGWDDRRLAQVLETLCALWTAGLFDWDPSPGNLLDDGRQLRLFDFGYCYRFDPRRQFNTAGRGDDHPMFHPVERFETRTFSGALLALEASRGEDAARAAFRREKAVAREVVRRLRADVAARGATEAVLHWLDGLVSRWAPADLDRLYLAENWRSHALDLDDDLRGRSCTPTTLRRADWLLRAIEHHHDALRAADALFHGDEALDAAALRARYRARREEARRWQLDAAPADGASPPPPASPDPHPETSA